MKPTNSPIQGQPNPGKNGLKVAFGPLFFPQQIIFSGLGLMSYRKQTTSDPTLPNPPQTPCYDGHGIIAILAPATRQCAAA